MRTILKLNAVRVALALTLSVNLALAGPPVIGTAVATGTFRVDHATVIGNATLEEGAVVETAQSSSSVELSSGARMVLGLSSRGRLYDDHMVLERGESRLERGAIYRVEALGLVIKPETGTTSGRVAFDGPGRVQVSVVTGSFRVLNSRGVLVANLASGSALEFEPQISSAGASPSGFSKVTGVLVKKAGHLLLTDETTNVTLEVAGPGLEKEIGNRVELTGSMDPAATPAGDASQYIRVSQIKHLGKGVPPAHAGAAAAGTAAGTAGGGATAGGILGFSVTTIAIIGGVAAAATLGGLAAANKLPGQGATAQPISR